METLAFGWNQGLVDGVKAAWGARLIVTQDGHVDYLADRQDTFGDVTALTEWLNTEVRNYPTGWDHKPEGDLITPFRKALANLRGGLRAYDVSTREAKGLVLYQDGTGAVIANTNASAGYCYVTAYRFADLPDGHPTLGLEYALNLEVK